jgi:Na+-driven multidrug efflux pump
MYAVALPVAALGLVTPLGVTAVYAALVLETFVPAAVTYWRYRAGTWKAVSREYRPDLASGA